MEKLKRKKGNELYAFAKTVLVMVEDHAIMVFQYNIPLRILMKY